jgi:hypothetical protein
MHTSVSHLCAYYTYIFCINAGSCICKSICIYVEMDMETMSTCLFETGLFMGLGFAKQCRLSWPVSFRDLFPLYSPSFEMTSVGHVFGFPLHGFEEFNSGPPGSHKHPYIFYMRKVDPTQGPHHSGKVTAKSARLFHHSTACHSSMSQSYTMMSHVLFFSVATSVFHAASSWKGP